MPIVSARSSAVQTANATSIRVAEAVSFITAYSVDAVAGVWKPQLQECDRRPRTYAEGVLAIHRPHTTSCRAPRGEHGPEAVRPRRPSPRGRAKSVGWSISN